VFSSFSDKQLYGTFTSGDETSTLCFSLTKACPYYKFEYDYTFDPHIITHVMQL